ncbi:MAG: cell division protein FtsA [Elusimicrobia bacterium]|nr:cell division protein FtsA [Elusimicrobiota bacterium]
MAKTDVIAGLDMGSGRVTCVIGAPDPETGELRALAGASVPCRGLNGGVVTNIPEAARAIGEAMEKAEQASKQMVRGVYLGVRGSHLQSFNNRGAYNIARTDKQITPEDVASVIENAKAIHLSSDREILHVLPQGFALDRQRGVPNPVGMEGTLLEVEVHINTASISHLNNLTKAVAQAGFEVIEPVYGLLACGEVVVTPEERELGALLVDFGGQSLSMGVYSEGWIRFTKDIAVGSDFITRDLAMGLRTSMPTAEKIKIEHGIAHPRLINGDHEIQFPLMDGRTSRTIKTSTMMEFILPRVEQIFSAVADDVSSSGFADMLLPVGAVLTGGGAQLRGMTDAAEQILNLPVRIGLPNPQSVGGPEELLTPGYATALGLLAFSQSQANWASSSSPGAGAKRAAAGWRRKLSSLIEDLF